MKLEKIQQSILCTILSFCLSFGSISCMITGLDLNAHLLLLGLAGIHLCGLFSIFLQLPWGGRFTLAGTGCILPLLLCFDSTRIRILSFIRDLWAIFAAGYELDLPPALANLPTHSADLALLVLMALVALCCSFTILRRRTLFLAMTPALLVLATCFVFTDTVPALWCILLWLFAAIILLITQLVRRSSSTQGLRLAKSLAIPVAVALLGMTLLVPPTTQNIPSAPISTLQTVWNWLQSKFPYIGTTAEGDTIILFTPAQTNQVSLGSLGPRNSDTTPVMEVTAKFTSSVYLRERDYDSYTGIDWFATENREEVYYRLPNRYTRMDGHISIQTFGRRNFRYVPCYPHSVSPFTDGYLPNGDYADEYTFYRTYLVGDWQTLWRQGIRQDIPAAHSRYLELPAATEADAKAILAGIARFSSMDELNKASAIMRYVRDTARYDVNSATMPATRDDFAIWFLQEAESGYCVHYATAATVLLRAAGIPARYVEGYQVNVRANQTTTVREDLAHAWVEYYLDGIGWIIMDPTPTGSEDTPLPSPDSSLNTLPPGPTPSSQPTTQPTTPSTTHPTSRPVVTQPTAPSAPITAPNTGGNKAASPLPTVALVLSIILLTIVGQWHARRRWKHRRMHRGSANVQGLARYREAQRLARWSKCALPDALTVLAQKAAFSQHTLTQEELEQFDRFFAECITRMQEQGILRKLYLRLILAAY